MLKLWITTEERYMREISPVTPGELLLEEFIVPMGIDPSRLAMEIRVPEERINEIISGQEPVTVDTDLRLCRFFGLSDGYWMRAQMFYELEIARETMQETLATIQPWNYSTQFQNNHST